MSAPKRFTHDRLLLLLLSVSIFLVILGSIMVGWRLGSRNSGYIVQYRANLGISAFKTGSIWGIVDFIGFMVMVAVLHTAVSVRAFRVRREYAVVIMGMGVLLLVMAIVVSNALLVT